VALGELAGLGVGVGDDHVPRQGPFRDRRGLSRSGAVRQELFLPGQEALEVGGRAGNPVVAERGGAPQRYFAPAADPDRRVRLRDGLGLDAAVDGVVAALEADRLLRPEALDDRELLFEPRTALL